MTYVAAAVFSFWRTRRTYLVEISNFVVRVDMQKARIEL